MNTDYVVYLIQKSFMININVQVLFYPGERFLQQVHSCDKNVSYYDTVHICLVLVIEHEAVDDVVHAPPRYYGDSQ